MRVFVDILCLFGHLISILMSSVSDIGYPRIQSNKFRTPSLVVVVVVMCVCVGGGGGGGELA